MEETETFVEIGKRLRSKSPPLEITLHRAGEESVFSSTLSELAGLLTDAAGDGVVPRQGRGEGIPAVPALSFSGEGRGTIHYLALPEDREIDPFCEMIIGEANGDLRTHLEALEEPIEILVFMATVCPHCPGAVRAANGLALASRRVTVFIVDAQQFPDLAERYKVSHVPATVVDGELFLNEVVPAERLADLLLDRGTDEYEKVLLQSQISSGQSVLASHRLLNSDRAAPAFLALWRKSTLTMRMGLLLAAQDALDEDPHALDGIVPGLIELLDPAGEGDDAVRGDTTDLLGQIGHPDARESIEAMLDDANPEIVEIAEEALENIADSD